MGTLSKDESCVGTSPKYLLSWVAKRPLLSAQMLEPGKSCRELRGWKEIAGHLGVSVRTAQNLEKSGRLPVRRGIGQRAGVFALSVELDAWRIGSAPFENDPHGIPESTSLGPPSRRISRRSMIFASAAGAITTGIVIGYERRKGSGVLWSATVAGNALSARDAEGNQLWKYLFQRTLRTFSSSGEDLSKRIRILRRASGHECRILFAAAFLDGEGKPEAHELYCFSADGRLLWRWRPDFKVRFGNDRFDGPWHVRDVVLGTEIPEPSVLLAISHWYWRPGFVISVDWNGLVTMRFANAGQVFAVRRIPTESGAYIIAGGVNNEYNAAAVSLFEEGGLAARSPQTSGSRFEIHEGPVGNPTRYLLLPPSEVNMASGSPYNLVFAIRGADKNLLIETWEMQPTPSVASFGTALYFVDTLIRPQRVTYGGTYAACHRQLQQEGKLTHGIADCPAIKTPVLARCWDPTAGWSIVSVPFAPELAPGAFHA